MFDRIRGYYNDVLNRLNADSEEAKRIRYSLESFEKISKAWDKAVSESIEKYTKSDKITGFEDGVANGNTVEYQNGGLRDAQKVSDKLRDRTQGIIDEYEGRTKGSNTENEKEESIKPEVKTELKSLFESGKIGKNEEIEIGKTSKFIREKLKAPSRISGFPVFMSKRKAYLDMVTAETALKNGIITENDVKNGKSSCHELGYDGLYEALEASENPVAAFVSVNTKVGNRSKNRITLVTDMVRKNSYVVVAMEFDTTAVTKDGKIPVNKDITVYEKSGISRMIQEAAEDGALLYFNQEKNSQSEEGGIRVQFPKGFSSVDYKNNINNFWENFKSQKEVNDEINKINQKYIETVESGDMENAQRMVDERAKANPTIAKDSKGNPKHLFRIETDNTGKTSFIYTSTEKQSSVHDTGDEVYGEIGRNPFVIDANGRRSNEIKVSEIGNKPFKMSEIAKWAQKKG